MFHRRHQRDHPAHYDAQQQRTSFWHRGPRHGATAVQTPYAPAYGNNYGPQPLPSAYYRDPYHQGFTTSDWDHYAVRHEEALIGDPLPIVNNGLNLSAQRYDNATTGRYGPGPLANGPINHGYDDTHYDKRHPIPTPFDKRGNPLIGPVTASGPLAGNYSSGTVVERNLVQGPGKRTRTGFVDDHRSGHWGSTAWGSEPLYGPRGGSGWNEPMYGYREYRETATPLLPDSPWTHNELGRDYQDAYRTGTLPYSSINNSFVADPIQESFTNYGPNGEIIEGTRTRVIREDIVPPVVGGNQALGTSSNTTTTRVVKDEVIPIIGTHSHDVINVNHHRPGLVTEKATTTTTSTTTAPVSTATRV